MSQPENGGPAKNVRVRLIYSPCGRPIKHEFQLLPSSSTRDLLAALPLDLRLRDYARKELIAEPPTRLSTAGVPPAHDARRGDLSHYAPWGNLSKVGTDD